MKDITGPLLASLFVVFVLISLLSVDRTQNSGLVTSRGKLDFRVQFNCTDIAPAAPTQNRLMLSGGT